MQAKHPCLEGWLSRAVVGIVFQLCQRRALSCWPKMERKAEAQQEPRRKRPSGLDTINMMQIRMPKADVSPMKKRLIEACSDPLNCGFNVTLHIYDLGPFSKWFVNSWNNPKETGFGAFHVGVEVLGVEWSFQAMLDCGDDHTMTGVMCHTPKSHPRHVYRESVWLGGSTLCANEICNVLARLERDWPASSYHFLSHNCTDFAEALSSCLDVPNQFPSWAHGLAKGLGKSDPAGKGVQPPWWLPSFVTGCCNSGGSCASESCAAVDSASGLAIKSARDGKTGKVTAPHLPGCGEICLASRSREGIAT